MNKRPSKKSRTFFRDDRGRFAVKPSAKPVRVSRPSAKPVRVSRPSAKPVRVSRPPAKPVRVSRPPAKEDKDRFTPYTRPLRQTAPIPAPVPKGSTGPRTLTAHRPLSAKANFVLNALSAKEISKGYQYDRVSMLASFKKGEPRFHKDTVGVKGVSLPVKTIQALQDGIQKPTVFINRVLESLYKRFQYHELRKAGASVKSAKALSSDDLNVARKAILQYSRFINKIVARKHVKGKGDMTGFDIIAAGFRRSEKTFQDFLYLLEKDLLGRDSPKSKGKSK